MYVIDDDALYRKLFIKSIKAHLKDDDIEIHEFEDGYLALNSLIVNQQHHPNKIFLDINMPKMNGWDFLDSVLKLNLHIKEIYLVTSSNSKKDIERAKQYNVQYYIKPIDEDKLIELLK